MVDTYKNKQTQSQITVSVILPVLNEAENLERLIIELAGLKIPPEEIVVVDGGSTDGTQEIAHQHHVLFIPTHRGRGHQIMEGLKSSQGDIVLVLHADMFIEDEIIDKIKDWMRRHPSSPGGALGNRFQGGAKAMKVIALLNYCRAKYYGISFGDQGQFFWRQAALDLNWVVPFPVMEDIELSARMKKVGKPLYLEGGIKSSTRRWDKQNKLANFFRLLHFIFKFYFASEKHKPLVARKIYQEYYHENLPDTL